jgi:hypothetical protein
MAVALALAACEKSDSLPDGPVGNPSLRLSGMDGCGESRAALALAEPKDELCAVVREGKVSFTHSNASFNCCLDSVSLELVNSGGVLRVIERARQTQTCRCTCEFTVYGEILDLDPGDYLLQVCPEGGPAVCSVTVRIM